jgi:8-amino-7-oxononanoate synthase
VFDWLQERLEEAEQQGLRRRLQAIEPLPGGMRVRIGAEEWINFASNDYLGLAAARGDWPAHGGGSGSSPLVCGYRPLQRSLEQRLAALEGTEAALVFPTGFAANLAVLSALPEAGDVILSDALNHASIIDGCRLSQASRVIYPHADARFVAEWLADHRDRYRRSFVVTDSIFSMDGDLAPLAELAATCQAHRAILIVDEAHATGVFGETGGGLCEAQQVKSSVPIRVGTLSKALGSIGGFVAGPKLVIDYLIQRGRSLIYSTALPSPALALSLDGLNAVSTGAEARSRLLATASAVRMELQRLGLDTGSSASQIIPVIFGEPNSAIRASAQLQTAGCWVPAIRPPSVPPGTARLRISLSAAHRPDEIAVLLEACRGLAADR